jgi:hypothetical protein
MAPETSSTWTPDELDRIGASVELELASYRADGSLRPFVTMWVVRVGDDLYVRSAYGPGNPWYRRAKASGTGRARAGDLERSVTAPDDQPAIDAAYHSKYDRYGPSIVATVVGADAHQVTIRLLPEPEGD